MKINFHKCYHAEYNKLFTVKKFVLLRFIFHTLIYLVTSILSIRKVPITVAQGIIRKLNVKSKQIKNEQRKILSTLKFSTDS